MVIELTNTDAGVRGEVRMRCQQPAVFAGWLEFLAIIERAADLGAAPSRGRPLGQWARSAEPPVQLRPTSRS